MPGAAVHRVDVPHRALTHWLAQKGADAHAVFAWHAILDLEVRAPTASALGLMMADQASDGMLVRHRGMLRRAVVH